MKTARGFTLVEMVVVLAIVGILATAAVPLMELTLRRTQEQALREGLRTLRTAIDDYKREVEAKHIPAGPGGTPYPPTLGVLVAGVPLLDEQGQPRGDKHMYFLRRLPRDPFAPPGVSAADSWGLRASTSPPDAPQPGADVYDVFTRSEARALDGSALKDW